MAAGSGDRHTSERAAQQCDWLVSTQPIAQAPAGAGLGSEGSTELPGLGRAGGQGGLLRPAATFRHPWGQPWAGRRSPGVGQPQEATVWAPRCREAEGEVAALGTRMFLDSRSGYTPISPSSVESVKSKMRLLHLAPRTPALSCLLRVRLAEPPS